MIRDPLIYLHDILESIENIEEDTQGISEEEFLKKRIIQQAVIRNLEIIGEASKQLSRDFKSANPSIPWNKITAMRNKIIHEYFGLKLNVIWQTINEDLPPLKKQIRKMLDNSSQ